MRNARCFAIVALILLAVTSSGCLDKTWSYDFTADSARLADWHHAGIVENFVLTNEGLSMVEGTSGRISSPVLFSGDISMTIEVDIMVDAEDAAWFEICLMDEKLGYEENCAYVCFKELGHEGENWELGAYGPLVEESSAHWSMVPGLVRNGTNTLKLDKKGSTIKLLINNTLVATFDMSVCAAEDYYLSISIGETDVGHIKLSKVNANCSGMITPDFPTP
ncbi:MAG TPA: hypothetical protein PLI10_01105 [Bacillota bacterium]|nr:hypothetical protein [Bacillota bacterium]